MAPYSVVDKLRIWRQKAFGSEKFIVDWEGGGVLAALSSRPCKSYVARDWLTLCVGAEHHHGVKMLLSVTVHFLANRKHRETESRIVYPLNSPLVTYFIQLSPTSKRSPNQKKT